MATLSGMAFIPATAVASPVPEAMAQAKSAGSASGVVYDETGEPMIGATVQVANNPAQGGATNIDGEFSIANVKPGTKLKVSAIGYKPIEVVWNGTNLTINLETDSQVLDEVVVTAMGIQRKESSLTYATQEIKGDDLMKVQNSNFVNALNGKVSGVTITQSAGGAGGASKILLRGNKSVMGNNAPLIVVDGIPMTNQVGDAASSYQSSWDPTYSSSGEGGDALALINPDDIESINVLKGANAAALYGSAAANGVLMITTKKGKDGKISVTVNSGVTFEKPLLTPELQKTYGSAIDLASGTLAVDAWGKKLSDLTADEIAFTGAHITNRYNDNVSDFFRTGTTWNNSIAISGGNEKIRSYFSYSNSNANGIIRSNNYNRNTFSFRQSYNMFNNKLHIDVAMNYVYAKTKNRAGGGTVLNPLYDLYLTAPNIDMAYYKKNIVNPNGQWESNSRTYFVGGTRSTGTVMLSGPQQIWAYTTAKHNNPYWLTDVNRGNTVEERAYGYATISYDIWNGLTAQARVNLDRAKLTGESHRYATTQSVAAIEDYGKFSQDISQSNDTYVDILLSYNNKFKDFDVSATAGWSGHSVQSKWQKIWADATYYNTSMDKLPTTVNMFEPTVMWAGSPVTYGKDSNWDKGLFFTGQVGWKDMVYLEGSYRQDWYRAFRQFTDRGTPDNYGYWSIGGNTLVHRYLTLPEFITHLKLRASYSEVGNSIPNVFYSLGTVNLTTGALVGSGYGYFANPRPEKSKSIEAGFDVSFFNNNLMWDLTYYHTDLTNSYFVAPSASGKSTPVNTGLIRNQGIETTLTYNILAGRDWMWKTGVNFSYNDNKIVKTFKNSRGEAARMEQSIANGKILVRYEEGGSYGDMYTLDFRRNENGSIWLSKNTGTPQLSPRNYVYLGNMNSKFQLGWSNTVTWKDLSLYFLINGRIGGKTISLTEAYLDNAGMSKRSGEARLAAEANNIYWTSADGSVSKPGMYIGETVVPIDEYYKTVGGQIFASDYVYNATNFRLAELSLGYTLRNLFKGAIKSLNLSFVGRNLFFIYKDSPVDPEISLSTKNGMGGVDVFNLPSTRSYGINLKLEF
ncbi:MAG: SusC/RagA family TonB-linked outer membrane protein [Firmicutes bacterium]|nr:SusC/RagA family TonB-linked outer membrane protein [Bacillota bacterium]MCM1401530.1 SusC/RagA family TonB-linked outer membrane protein [Bacteroides sp.]MCM1476576.1 SusC/RagA family TonB-linked outer membrane protein [Bacteroides sp.]